MLLRKVIIICLSYRLTITFQLIITFNFFRNPPKVSFRNGQNVEILLTLSWDAEKLRNAPISGKIRPKLEELLCQKCKHTKSLLWKRMEFGNKYNSVRLKLHSYVDLEWYLIWNIFFDMVILISFESHKQQVLGMNGRDLS